MIGHVQVPGRAQIGSLEPLLSDKAGLMMHGMTLDLLEEVKSDLCELLPANRTVSEAQLENGDILIALCWRDGHPLPQVRMYIQLVQCLLALQDPATCRSSQIWLKPQKLWGFCTLFFG